MSNSIAPGSSADVNVKVTALTTNPNVPVTYKTIILKKNLVNGVNTLTQEMMSATNTKYVVKYDYTLTDDVTIPENCILEFDGGSISGEHTITGQNTVIEAGLVKIFSTDVTLAGTFNNLKYYLEWFGAKGDGTTDDTLAINKTIISVSNLTRGGNIILSNMYAITDSIKVWPNTTLIGCGHSYYANFNGLRGKCGLKYIGETTNLWIVDFVNPEYILPYNQLGTEVDTANSNNRNTLLEFGGFTITTTTKDVFGGLRVVAAYDKTIRDLYVYGTRYGIALSWSWNISLMNVESSATTNAYFFGNCCTNIKMFGCQALRMNFIQNTEVENFSDAIFGASNSRAQFTLPYLNPVHNCAILADGRGESASNIFLYGFVFQDYEACIIQNMGYILLSGTYIERAKTLYWTYSGRIVANTPQVHVYDMFNYQFGTHNGIIEATDYKYSRCYPNNSSPQYRKIKNYIIHVVSQEYISFYDTYEVSGNTTINREYTETKYIDFENPMITISTLEEGSTINQLSSMVALGVGEYNGSVHYSEVQKRFEKIFSTFFNVQTLGYINGSDIVLKNKEVHFIGSPDLSDNYIRLANDVSLANIFNSKVFIDRPVRQDSAANAVINVLGGQNEIIINRTDAWNPYIVNMANTDYTEVTIRNIGTYNLSRIIKSNQSSGAYKITVIERDNSTTIYTNMQGTFANAPSGLTSDQKGFKYYCISGASIDGGTTEKTNIPIYWTGSSWVDANGNAVVAKS